MARSNIEMLLQVFGRIQRHYSTIRDASVNNSFCEEFERGINKYHDFDSCHKKHYIHFEKLLTPEQKRQISDTGYYRDGRMPGPQKYIDTCQAYNECCCKLGISCDLIHSARDAAYYTELEGVELHNNFVKFIWKVVNEKYKRDVPYRWVVFKLMRDYLQNFLNVNLLKTIEDYIENDITHLNDAYHRVIINYRSVELYNKISNSKIIFQRNRYVPMCSLYYIDDMIHNTYASFIIIKNNGNSFSYMSLCESCHNIVSDYGLFDSILSEYVVTRIDYSKAFFKDISNCVLSITSDCKAIFSDALYLYVPL
jgi:hypothetical protein